MEHLDFQAFMDRMIQVVERQAAALEQLAQTLDKLNEKIAGSEWWGRGI